MPMPATDLTGRVFGYLTILRRVGTTQTIAKRALWEARCICGKLVVRIGTNLLQESRGKKKSCGCRRREMYLEAWGTHGMTSHRAFHTWSAMKSRCGNPNDKDWRNYGARGISVCERWQQSFDAFWEDMGFSYKDGLTIERKDNSGNYHKDNCKWATVREQSNNRRTNVYLDTPAGRLTIAQAAREFGVKEVTLAARLKRGWPVLRALGLFTTSLTPAQDTALPFEEKTVSP